MIRFPSVRRLTVLIGGTLLGATAVLAVAAPASAHHSVVTGKPACDTATGEWLVTWTVDTVAPRGVNHYKLLTVQVGPSGSTVSDIAQTTADSYPYTVGKPLAGEQRLPGTATSASLAVQAEWENGYVEKAPVGSKIELGGACERDKPKPDATFASACDGSVTVTLINGADAKATAEFTVSGVKKPVAVKPGGSETVVVPAAAAGEIIVKVNGEVIQRGGFTPPANCAPASVAHLSDCDSLTISIESPAGTTPVKATLTPDRGQPQTVTVAPGETKEVTFKATAVKLTIGDKSETIPWKPVNCGGAAGGGPSLPVTGSSISGAVGVAGGLLAIGGGLFYFFRRRRVHFTA